MSINSSNNTKKAVIQTIFTTDATTKSVTSAVTEKQKITKEKELSSSEKAAASTTASAASEASASTTEPTADSELTTEKDTTSNTTEKENSKDETTLPAGKFIYSGYGNGIIITSYSGNESNITVPNEIDGKTVLAVGEKAFSNNKSIRSITFEDGISAKNFVLKPSAFYNLTKLNKVNLPSRISADNFDKCFYKCKSLKNVSISRKFSNTQYYSSNGIVYYSNNKKTALVFYPQTKSDSRYNVPSNVTSINRNAFNGNAYLKTIKFSKRVQLYVDWKNIFSDNNLKNLETIEVYPGTDADLKGIKYFNGEIIYYD